MILKTNLYKLLVRPILFRINAETNHNFFTNFGYYCSRNSWFTWLIKKLHFYADVRLESVVAGVKFPNPIGLGAGFDYDGYLAGIMPTLGFGFNTVGTVTAQSYEGNQQPRLLRLPTSNALFVNKGFKSQGADAVFKRLSGMRLKNQTLGVSVGSSNTDTITTIDSAIADYVYTFKLFSQAEFVSYFELNISCPNTKLKETFVEVANFQKLCLALNKLDIQKPIFVKLPNELSEPKLVELIDCFLGVGNPYFSGVILANLVKDRANSAITKKDAAKIAALPGNISGKPTHANALNLISRTRARYPKLIIIGCGGVFSVTEALELISAGANLVQLVTGVVYEGPGVASAITRRLTAYLSSHNYTSFEALVKANKS